MVRYCQRKPLNRLELVDTNPSYYASQMPMNLQALSYRREGTGRWTLETRWPIRTP